jgi:hypothetical protein
MNEQRDYLQIIEAVRERDIDLLILEEFYAQTGFDKLFLKVINKQEFIFSKAYRSVTTAGLGETDIQVEFINKVGNKLYILIENKVDAEFQDAQYERYLERANLLKTDIDEAYVILTAPELYIKQKSEFKYHLSYEDIKEWFNHNYPEKNRGWYKRELLRLAIEQERRGYQTIKDEVVTLFWKQYFEYIQEVLPELQMNDPKIKPTQSSFVYFHPKWLPVNMKLIHKMDKGYLDLELSGKAENYDEIVEEYGSKLSENMEIVITGKSICFRFELPVISFEKSFDEQKNVIRHAVDKCLILKEFIFSFLKKTINQG